MLCCCYRNMFSSCGLCTAESFKLALSLLCFTFTVRMCSVFAFGNIRLIGWEVTFYINSAHRGTHQRQLASDWYMLGTEPSILNAPLK